MIPSTEVILGLHGEVRTHGLKLGEDHCGQD